MTAPDKLAGIKPGDTVEVTFRGVVAATYGPNDQGFAVTPEGGMVPTMFADSDTQSPHFTIKRIVPELKVGDRVQTKHTRIRYFVIAIAGENVWVADSLQPALGQCWSSCISDLERA